MRPVAGVRRLFTFMATGALILSVDSPARSGEKEVPAFLEKSRESHARGEVGLQELVRQDRGTTFEAVEALLNGQEREPFPLAQVLARAYEGIFLDRSPAQRVEMFRRRTDAQRALRQQAMLLKEAGKTAFARGRMGEAATKFKQALDAFRRVGDLVQEGRCLSNLGSVAVVEGKGAAARQWSEAARAVVRRSGDLGLLVSLEITRFYDLDSRGDLAGARAALESALAAARQWNDREGEGAVLLNLGSVAEAEGDLDEALRVARRAAEIGHAVGNAEMESTGWNNQAALHNDRGDLQSALREFEKAVEVAHRGSLLRPEAEARLNLAGTLRRMDEVVRAEEELARARQAAATADYAILLARIDLEEGRLRLERAHYQEALPFFDAAEQRLKGADGPDRLAEIHEARSVALYYLGRYPEALDQMRRSADGFKAAGRATLGATTHKNVGLCLYVLGDSQGGMKELETAVRMDDEAGDLLGKGADLDALGAIRFRVGDIAGARRALEEALAILPEEKRPKDRAEAMSDLAEVELAAGPARREKGFELLRASSRIFTNLDDVLGCQRTAIQMAQAHLKAGDTRAALAVLGSARAMAGKRRSAEYEWNLLYLEGRAADAAGDSREAARRYAQSIEEVERLRSGVAPDRWRAAILEDRIAPYRAFSRWLRQRGEVEQAYRIARLAKARTFVERLLPPPLNVDLKSVEEIPRDMIPRPAVPLSRLQQRLNSRELLLDFFYDDEGLVAFAVDRSHLRAAEITRPADSARLEEWLEILRRPGRPEPSQEPVTRAWRAAARRAGELLFRPFQAEMLASDRIFIAPNGPLHGVPFAALAVETRPLVERWSLALLPAAETLLEKPERVDSEHEATMIFGNPASGKKGEDLPGADEEARRVASRVGPVARLYLGEAASEAVFWEQAPSQTRIHLAAHGRIDTLAPGRSYIQLAPGGDRDGRLEAAEIASMNLRASLVVLSGCETGWEGGVSRGSAAGDERAGLVRAFLAAGAQSVIASLWEVDDKEARIFMPELYSLLADRSPSDALAELQRELLSGRIRARDGRSLDHPFYWAGLMDYGSR